MIECLGGQLIRTAYQSPWQNGVAGHWVGSCRTELLDQVVVFNEAPLPRRVREYLRYYHEDRIHDGLGKDTPVKRPKER
jgi:putative transposase